MCVGLNAKQTIMQYIRSNEFLQYFCRNNVKRNKLFGHRNAMSERMMRQAMRHEDLQTEICRLCKLEMFNAES